MKRITLLLISIIVINHLIFAQDSLKIVYRFPNTIEKAIEKKIHFLKKREKKLYKRGFLAKQRQLRIVFEPFLENSYIVYIEPFDISSNSKDIVVLNNRFANISGQFLPIVFTTDCLVAIKGALVTFDKRHYNLNGKRLWIRFRSSYDFIINLREMRIISSN